MLWKLRRHLSHANLLIALALPMLAISGCGSAATDRGIGARTQSGLVSIGAGLLGPSGLKAAVYARGPRTMVAFAFDSAGRLWFTVTGLETGPRSRYGVYLVAKEGVRPQGVIAGLNEPIGLDWYAGKLYVASVGRVDAYWDFNGTRFARHKTILKIPGAKGTLNNLLTMAPDGRFLMAVGATCERCAISKWEGAIVSFKPDGSDLRVYAGRIHLPFGLIYYPGTSDLFVSMDQPDYKGRGDWLSIVREGEEWGFPGCYGQGGPSCAGVPAPLATLDPGGAASGIAIATGQLGPSVGTSALVGEWQVSKVQRVALARTSSGFRSTDVTPFLRGIRGPIALAFAPDGSLLVGDWSTGTIYRIYRAS